MNSTDRQQDVSTPIRLRVALAGLLIVGYSLPDVVLAVYDFVQMIIAVFPIENIGVTGYALPLASDLGQMTLENLSDPALMGSILSVVVFVVGVYLLVGRVPRWIRSAMRSTS